MSDEVDLGDLSTLADGEMRACEAGGVELLVCRVQGELFALEDVCSHADTPLSEGTLSGHLVACPLHAAQFDVRDGSHTGPPAYTGVRCFDVSEGPAGARIDLSSGADDGDDDGPPSGYFQTR
ncbi:MAG: Rieske 2Fe-2S domain-containing protein [Actinomycetota bacterium]